ncbi:hypothetical protein VT84_24510 [Gemmata sp. SH-PL17]|uniref:hypothetical protein n=1 Tax=Gemmata sp. SH-PL17 TaxID=1630693 RepID=UPI00078E2D78|nr:hypothetical protein [Gemmata sp. SH-PL17]AMV27587.1 hypothetical protein VT84_24510 [Gemmata sp. SH-PL17]
MALSNRRRLSVDRLDDRIMPAVLINEVLVNPPGSPDSPTEYIELRVTAGSALSQLNNLYIVALEGEKPGTGSSDPGSVDLAYKLTATDIANFKSKFDADNNNIADAGGIILLTGTGHGYTNAASTSVVITIPELTAGSSYKGLENGASSFVLLTYAGTLQADLDTNGSLGSGADGDGVLDAIAGVAYLDGVGYLDKENSGDFVYGAKIPFDADFTPDILVRDSSYTTQAFSGVAGAAGANSTAVAGNWYAAELVPTRLGVTTDWNSDGLQDGANWQIDTTASTTFGTFPAGTNQTTAGAANLA